MCTSEKKGIKFHHHFIFEKSLGSIIKNPKLKPDLTLETQMEMGSNWRSETQAI